jgi:hypothetical protein
MFPKKDRKVYRYVYLSDYPTKVDKVDASEKQIGMDNKAFQKKSKEIQNIESTTDVTLFGRAAQNNILRMSFFRTLQEASLDCAIHYGTKNDKRSGPANVHGIRCRMCLPTDVPLYAPDLRQDMKLPSSCEPMHKEKIKAKEVTVNDTKYMYTIDTDKKLHVFQYDRRIEGYREIFAEHPEYYEIYKAIKTREKNI